MVIGTCGFGSTGSSVVSDYLKEFDTFQVMDNIEFAWVALADGLIDLDFHVNFPHGRTIDSINAIARYRQLCRSKMKSYKRMGLSPQTFAQSVNDFLDSITQTKWMWTDNSTLHKNILDSILRRIILRSGLISKWEIRNGRHWTWYPFEEVSLSVKPDNFLEAAKKHIHEMLVGMGADFSRPIVLDQAFSGNNPQSCMKYYEDAYAIVVDRDPRDIFVFGRTRLLGRVPHLMPIDNVKDFVVYYRVLRRNQPYGQPDKRILNLKFEDLVYHYDETTKRIRDFLDLPDNPNPKSIFDPAISMSNTQVWKRFPQFAKEIEYIEKELPEYLFDFSGCPIPDPNGKMFHGKSPKNIKKK